MQIDAYDCVLQWNDAMDDSRDHCEACEVLERSAVESFPQLLVH
jgi:hypothetical protein